MLHTCFTLLVTGETRNSIHSRIQMQGQSKRQNTYAKIHSNVPRHVSARIFLSKYLPFEYVNAVHHFEFRNTLIDQES